MKEKKKEFLATDGKTDIKGRRRIRAIKGKNPPISHLACLLPEDSYMTGYRIGDVLKLCGITSYFKLGRFIHGIEKHLQFFHDSIGQFVFTAGKTLLHGDILDHNNSLIFKLKRKISPDTFHVSAT